MSTSPDYSAATPDTSNNSHLIEDDEDDDDDEDGSPIPPNLDVPIPKEGDVYTTFESLRYAINAWALRDKFLTRCHKKDSARAIYVCRYNATGCQWRVRGNIARNKPNHILVTVVTPEHTCKPKLTLDENGKFKYGTRGVQYTQRWVRDAVTRLGFHITVDTEPKEIVKVIQEEFGENITDRLAYKSKMSLLAARGDIPPPELAAKSGRPTRAVQEERQREAELAMEQRRAADRLPREQEAGIIYGEPIYDQRTSEAQEAAIEERPFVFESGFRIIGPAHTASGKPTQALRNPHTASANVDIAGCTSMSSTETRWCHMCAGTGVLPRYLPHHSDTDVVGDEDDELTTLQKQVALISKQIEQMQRRRAGGLG